MSKLIRRFIDLDYDNSNTALRAQDIPFDSLYSITKQFESIRRLDLYASPDGTGDGFSSGNPTTLESIRTRYSDRSNYYIRIHLTGGEHVLQYTFNINAARVEIYGDAGAWSSNPTIICTTSTQSDKVDDTWSGYATCAAHTEPAYMSLYINGSWVVIRDCIVRSNHPPGVWANQGSFLQVSGKFKFQTWSHDSYDYARPLTASRNSIIEFVEVDESNDNGLYVYESEEVQNGNASLYHQSIGIMDNSYLRFSNNPALQLVRYSTRYNS